MAVHKESPVSVPVKAKEVKGSTPSPPAAKGSKPISSAYQGKHPAAEFSGENKHVQSKANHIKQPKGGPRPDASPSVKETPPRNATGLRIQGLDSTPPSHEETPPRNATGLRIQGLDSTPPSHDIASFAITPILRQSSKTLDASSDSVTSKLRHLSKSGDFRSESMRKPKEFLPPLSLGSSTKGPAANGAEKSTPPKGSTSALCSECRAISEGAVCFIGNDGRVSACSSRTAPAPARLCKNPKCANSNPELAANMATVGPKKYLVSKRHSLKAAAQVVLINSKTAKAVGTRASSHKSNDSRRKSQPNQVYSEGVDCRVEGDLGDHFSTECAPADGCHGSGNGVTGQRVRRRSFSVIEKQGPEEVTLRKQMTQERRNAEEWMLDYAIEEALHKLGPTKGTKVKVLVEAFESVIPQKDSEAASQEVKLQGCGRICSQD